MTPKTKIVYIVNSLGIGGAEKIVRFLAQSFAEEHNVTILCLREKLEQDIELHPKIKIIYFPISITISYSTFSYITLLFPKLFFRKQLVQFEKIIKELAPDILHFHTKSTDLALGFHLNKKIRLVFTEHLYRYASLKNKGLKNSFFKFLLIKLYANYNQIFISKNNYNHYKTIGIINVNKTNHLISNCTNIKLFTRESSFKKESKSVVYISRIDPRKGHSDLIQAWSKISFPSKKLYLVGPDETNGAIQQLAQKICKENEINFTGGISNVKPILEQSMFGVFPSYQEGLPLSLLEMMAMELPVIVSDIPELTSIVTHNVHGLVYKLGDINDLKEKIELLLNNPDLCTQLGKNARKLIEKEYNNENYIQKHIDFYNEILNS